MNGYPERIPTGDDGGTGEAGLRDCGGDGTATGTGDDHSEAVEEVEAATSERRVGGRGCERTMDWTSARGPAVSRRKSGVRRFSGTSRLIPPFSAVILEKTCNISSGV